MNPEETLKQIEETKVEIPEHLRNMTIGEAIELPEFRKHLIKVMNAEDAARDNALRRGGKFKYDPIAKLDNERRWNADTISCMYRKALDKELDEPMRLRTYVRFLGDAALNEAILELKQKAKGHENTKKIANFLWVVLGIMYFPVYAVFFLCFKFTRILMSATYVGMLEFGKAWDTFRFTFKNPYR